MNNRDEKKLMIKIARMYYEEGLTQSEISEELGIYRTSISRWLKKSRAEGIVKTTIDSDMDETFDLELQLAKTFCLREAVIIPTKKNQTATEKKKAIATAGAEFIKRVIRDGDVVGFSWGSTIASIMGEFTNVGKKDAHFVPLVGGPGPMNTKHHVNTIVYNIAEDFNGTAYFIDAAAVVEKKETKNDIVHSHYFHKIKTLWDSLNIAVMGIGNPNQSSNLVWKGFCGSQEIEGLNKQGAIGDMCSRFYGIDGKLIHSDLSDRTIAIELEKLKNIPYSIGIAESVEKAPSIIGGLRGGYINTLVTTEETASEILKIVEEEMLITIK